MIIDSVYFCWYWRKSVTTFFAAYDALCEEGTATSVCKVFDEVADLSVPGSKDFMKVQGEVLEGLVARIVNHGTLMRTEKVLRDFHPQPFEVDLDLGPSLREICAANRSDEWQKIKALLHSTDDAFCLDYSDWFETEPSDEYTRKADQSVISKFLEAHPTDFCTAKLQEMIHLMKEKHYCVKLQCYHNFSKMVSLSNDRVYVKMTIDAYSDSAFRRYEQEMRCGPGLWPLYQGLFFEVSIFKATRDRAVDIAESGSNSVPNICDGGDTSEKDNLAVEDANLRIKLKFLPYRLRTSLIRNGLSVLFMEGRAAYRAYYLRQMKSWGISSEKQWATSKMLDEWSFYVRKKYDPRQLSPSIYLSEVEPFLEQYAKRSQENKSLVGSAGNSVTDEDFLAIEDGTEFGSAGNLARSEDFLAEDGTDGEGDFANHLKPAFSTSASLVGNKSPKNEGLIIFFPGMPGSTKSGICREINAKDGLGDGRRVHWLMGNHIKGIGRNYWQELADECRRKPHSVILADKNAPNEDAWRQIERICRKTKSSAVPVVTDSEGTNSNPFCLDTLAVHMFHVHQRDYHTGNLDKASPKAGYVLLLFYHLNEGKSRKEFERDLVERFGSLVRVPLLKSDRSPIPDPIRSTLEEGISLFKLHRQKHPCLESLEGSYSKDWAMWEEKMQNIILENSAYLDYIQVPFEDRVKQVLEQLRTIATGESAALSTERRKFGTIAFAAVSLPLADIQSLLDSLAENNPGVEAFLKGKDTEKSFMKTYITLAHKKCHGVVAVANYGPLLYQKVPVDLTALFFSEKVAAFEASLGSADGEKIISKDQWPHVTIWTGRVPEEEVNLLPQLVSEDKATRININPPTGMLGTLEFY